MGLKTFPPFGGSPLEGEAGTPRLLEGSSWVLAGGRALVLNSAAGNCYSPRLESGGIMWSYGFLEGSTHGNADFLGIAVVLTREATAEPQLAPITLFSIGPGLKCDKGVR